MTFNLISCGSIWLKSGLPSQDGANMAQDGANMPQRGIPSQDGANVKACHFSGFPQTYVHICIEVSH